MRPTIVAGGAGFIGSHLVDRLLDQGQRVVVIDDLSTGSLSNLQGAKKKHPAKLTFHKVDICSPKARQLIIGYRPEIVHLLAAQWSVKASMRDPLLDARVNIVGIVNILEAARRAGVRKVVFASSGGTIYGDHDPADLPLSEQAARDPGSFYGLTKSVAVDYLRLYRQVFGLESVALALGNVYGPRQSPLGEAGVIAIFGKKLINKEPCIIYGDGLTTRDYVYVSDVVNAFITASKRGQGLYNIGTGTETSVLEIFKNLSTQLKVRVKPTHADSLPEVRRVLLDVTKAQKELGWKAQVHLKEGAASVLDWIRETQNKESHSVKKIRKSHTGKS